MEGFESDYANLIYDSLNKVEPIQVYSNLNASTLFFQFKDDLFGETPELLECTLT